MSRWPADNQSALIAFYGKPGNAVEAQLVPVVPPFRMTYEGQPIKAIKFHMKAAKALLAALNEIWEHYGRDQAKIDAAGISRYDGAYNPRFIRGSTTKWSNHAYGAAIDINAKDNGFGTGHGTMPKPVVDAFKRQGARWGGDYHGRTDPMHFEFCDNGEPDVRLPQEPDPKPEPQAPLEGRAAILDLAAHSAIVHYDWKGRGRAPLGYIKGMALVYARLLPKLHTADQAAVEMARPVVGDKEHDALAWYDLHGGSGVERLRALFTLMIGLGMRESSGKFCEGRDRSADNVTADTAEAGLFQMSWDITRTVPLIKTVHDTYAKGSLADGLRDVFVEGVRCSETDYRNFGVGPGADFQKLAKERPAFAVEAAAVGLRNMRKHWGPINRKEAEVRPEAEALLRQIEALADKGHVA